MCRVLPDRRAIRVGAAGRRAIRGHRARPGTDAVPTNTREVYRDGDVTLVSGANVTVATMTAVSPGAYLVFAKTTLVQTNPENGGTERIGRHDALHA